MTLNTKHKILIIAPSYGNSVVGAGRFIEMFVGYSNYEIHTMSDSQLSNYPVPSNYNKWQNKISLLSRSYRYNKLLNEIYTDYDLIVFNNPILAYFLNKRDTEYFVFVHDDDNMNIEYSFSSSYILKKLYKAVERSVLKKAPKIIVNSKYLRRSILSNHRTVDANKISILYQGIEIDKYPLESFKNIISSKEISILYVKTSWQRGRLDILIKALSLITDIKFKLTICGIVPPYGLKDYANISYNILGKTNHAKVLKQYRQHNIFCVPVMKEALGVANMEAMAMGIPIVTTRVGGIPEVIGNGGWFCNTNDALDLKRAILQCINSVDERLEKVNYCIERVKQFSFENTATNFDKLIKQHINE